MHVSGNGSVNNEQPELKKFEANTSPQKIECVWAELNNNDDKVDLDDVIYSKDAEFSGDISKFLKENNGKSWTEALKKELNMLIRQYNNKVYANNIKESWTEVEMQPALEPPKRDKQKEWENLKGENVIEATIISDDSSNLEKKEAIKKDILNLKQGESYTFKEQQSGIGFKSESTVVVTRQEDNTLLESRAGVLSRVSFPYKKAVQLNTVYDENYGNKISEDYVDARKSQWGVVSTRFYDENGEQEYVLTKLKDLDKTKGTLSVLSDLKLASRTFLNQTLFDTDGKVLFEVRDGKFFNAKGKEIASDKAWDKLQKAIDNGELKELRQDY